MAQLLSLMTTTKKMLNFDFLAQGAIDWNKSEGWLGEKGDAEILQW